MNIRTNKKTVDEFRSCETGAHEDEMRGPSPLTTFEILSRSECEIIVNTAEEAAQIADCCEFGTFPDFCPKASDRIYALAVQFPGAREVLKRWQREEMAALVDRAREVLSESNP
jgi:hypothetical protein